MYLMFLGDMRQGGDWQDAGINGMYKFINRVWALANEVNNKKTKDPKCLRQTHKTIKKVTSDLENLKYNTAIAGIMEYVNYLQTATKESNTVNKQVISVLAQLLSPFAPFIAEEIWEMLGNKDSIFKQPWPKYDEKLAKEDEIELVVQINGKVRDKIKVRADISEDKAKKVVYESEKVRKWIKGKKIVKEIFIKGKLFSIVVK
jgi:leucyl-tRNA synthetase